MASEFLNKIACLKFTVSFQFSRDNVIFSLKRFSVISMIRFSKRLPRADKRPVFTPRSVNKIYLQIILISPQQNWDLEACSATESTFKIVCSEKKKNKILTTTKQRNGTEKKHEDPCGPNCHVDRLPYIWCRHIFGDRAWQIKRRPFWR